MYWIKHFLQPPSSKSSKVLNAANRAIYIYFGFFNKNNNNRPLHCASSINSNLQMATVYLVFLKAETVY